MKFYKYQGLGNDFIIIEEEIEKKLIKKLCDRHFGIGADGLIVYNNVDNKPFMTFYNADGSSAKMCGNGIRCYASFLDYKNKDFSVIKTLAGDKQIDKIGEFDYKVCIGNAKVEFENKILFDNIKVNFLNTGTEHVAIIVDEKNFNEKKLLEYTNKIVSNKKVFPNGTNVNVAKIVDEHNIEVLTYERGVGITLACGTGASACVYVAYKQGLVKAQSNVKLLGGNLIIQIEENGEIYMTGAAKKVFTGEIHL